jgi:hypothetical protein
MCSARWLAVKLAKMAMLSENAATRQTACSKSASALFKPKDINGGPSKPSIPSNGRHGEVSGKPELVSIRGLAVCAGTAGRRRIGVGRELHHFHGLNFYIVAARPAFPVVSFIFPTLDWRVRFSRRVPPQTAGLPTLRKPEPPHLESIRSYLAVAYRGAAPIVQLRRQFQLSPRSV